MKLLVKYLLLLSCFCLSTACDNEEDSALNSLPPNWGFYVFVEDAETGADLLNPEVEGNIVSDQINMVIDSETYYVDDYNNFTQYDLEWGFMGGPGSIAPGKYYLAAGGFRWDRATFGVLNWGDGTQNTFVYYPASNGDWSLWIDGVKGDRNIAVIRR